MNLFKTIFKGMSYLAFGSLLYLNTSCATSKIQYNPNSLEEKINKIHVNEKYAVLISGHSELRHFKNIKLAYKTLLSLDFKEENIFVFEDYSKSENFELNQSSPKKRIKSVFQDLSKKINSNDVFLLYVTGHGSYDNFNYKLNDSLDQNQDPYLFLDNSEKIYSNELKEYLDKLNPQTGLLIFDQCYGGGFAKNLGTNNLVALSASNEYQLSFSNKWTEFFWNSFLNNVGDQNSDEKVSILEAFNYANSKDKYSNGFIRLITFGKVYQEPNLVSEIDPKHLFLD
jgi:hypothetical protein